MTDSNRAIQALCQRCGKWREAVNRETEWTCRECHLEQQGQRLLAVVEARGRERDAALKGQEEAQAVAREYHDYLWSCFNQFPVLAWLAEELRANALRLPWLEEEQVT